MSQQPEIKTSYEYEEGAIAVATWLASKCHLECEGTWYPRVWENLGWHCEAQLDKPFIATMTVSERGGVLRYYGGFVAEPGHSGWLHGECAGGYSPLEVMYKSYNAIVGKGERLKERLRRIDSLSLFWVNSNDS